MARKPKKSEVVKKVASEPVEASELVEEATNAEPLQDEAVTANQQSGCGSVLSAERVNQDLSTKDVAKQLRLSSTQIDALEQDDYASLPEATIVKGFIRNYAKLLKIPAEPLLNAYVKMVPAKEDYSFALNPGINMKITESGTSHKLRYFLIAAAILLGAGVWFFYQNYVQKPSPVNPMPDVVEALPELALPMSERMQGSSSTQLDIPGQQAATGGAVTQQSTINNEETVEKEADVDGAAEVDKKPDAVELIADDTLESPEGVKPDTADTEAVAPEGVVNDTPPALGKTRLAFAATQETWISVVNTSGKEVFSKILYAGNHEVVDVRNPAEVVVGNAHGATLSIDGKAIDLAPYTRINVARLRMNRLR